MGISMCSLRYEEHQSAAIDDRETPGNCRCSPHFAMRRLEFTRTRSEAELNLVCSGLSDPRLLHFRF